MAWFGKKDPAAPSTPTPKSGGARPKASKVSALLSTECILIQPGGGDKNAVLESVVKCLCKTQGFPAPELFLNKVLEREKGISTTLDTGLSLPHARMDDLPAIVAGMAVLPQGIPDPQQSDLLIRVMFVFFSPNKPEAFPLHLQLLRSVSSIFQPAFIDQLAAAKTPADALELIKKVEG